MRFLGLPAASAWLLLAGVAALVVALYLLKPSARRLVVASSLIWQRVLERRRRKPERWRWWLSLLLALAIALSITAALTRPQIAVLSGAAADVVLVVDTGASMATRTADGRTRLTHALARGEAIMAAGGAGSRFLVADTTHQVATPAFESREEALARLRALRPQAGVLAWFPDVAQLSPHPEPSLQREAVEVWFITDGVARLALPPRTRTVSVFELADNAGITAFEVRASPAEPRRYDAYLELGNASPGGKRVQVQVAGVGAAPTLREVDVAGGASARLVLDLSAYRDGPLQASIAAQGDAFELDNLAYAYLPAKARARVGLVTTGNPALLRSLRLLPRVEVEVIAPGPLRELSRYDALVLDRFAPPRPPALPALLIAPGAVPWLPPSASDVSDTRIEQWDANHPLLAALPLRDVIVERAAWLRMEPPRDGTALPFTPLARGSRGEPLILATREGRRFALLSFALEASNFAQQAGFPAFLSNAVDWLTREPRALAHALGQVSVPASDARVLDLEGVQVPTRATPGATVFDAYQPGLFTAVTREERLRIAVNAFDPGLTAVNASRFAQDGAAPPAVGSVPRLRADPWLLLLALAALLLTVEWWTYNRRVTL